jgi:predicted secreted hydrolase
VDVINDLPHKPRYTINSWFAIGHLDSGSGTISYLVHILAISIKGVTIGLDSVLSVTHEGESIYKVHNNLFSGFRANASKDRFEINTPTALMSGTLDNLSIRANAKDLAIDLNMSARGYPLYNKRSARFELLGMEVFQYSIPTLNTIGKIIVGDKEHSVSGVSWFDRQWQNQRLGPPKGRWVWMDLNLSNGWHLSLWAAEDENGRSESWATLLDVDGGHRVVSVSSLFKNSFDLWQSPQSGFTYPTRWLVKIEELEMAVEVFASPKEQEVVGVMSARFEGACRIEGKISNVPVNGRCYVEMVGDWKAKKSVSKSISNQGSY